MRRILTLAMISLIIAAGSITVPADRVNAASPFSRGVNLCGLEFGDGSLPGSYGTNYISPTMEELDYFQSRGLTVIRLPFRWERVQRSLYGPLDPTDLGYLDNIIAGARARGMRVLLNAQNFARYRMNGGEYVIGSPQVPRSAFSDFWQKMAAHYANEPAIYAYGLVNEPHDMGSNDWKTSAQEAVNAIRTVDMNHAIAVGGDGWSGAWNWDKFNSNLIISDPANNILYEAHQYFDANGSGAYANGYDGEGAYPNIGVDRLQPFLNWLHAHGLKGFIGEYGVPDSDGRWLTVMDNFLTTLDQEGMDAFYWAAGPWWGSYPLSIDASKGSTPQLPVIQNHLSGENVPPPSNPPPTTPPPSAAKGYSAGGSANPSSTTPGRAVTLDLSVASSVASNVLVDLEVHQNGTKVFQEFYPSQSFASGETKNYRETYIPLSAGVYTVQAGVFTNDWSHLYEWFDSVSAFSVGLSAQDPRPPLKVYLPIAALAASSPAPVAPAPSANSSFVGTGSASPSSSSIGTAVSLNLVVKAAAASNVLVDLEVYSNGSKAFQKFYSSQSFAAGEAKSYAETYTPPSPGTYTLKAGVFSNDWATLYNWTDSLTDFTVSGQASQPVPPPSGQAGSNLVVSRGKPAYASSGNAAAVVDGSYGDGNAWNPGNPSVGSPAWVAIKIGGGYSRLLLNWTSTYSYNYNETTYGGPGNYQVQTSGDSTNGADGTWTVVANVTGNYVRARAHSFDFTGKSWVRLLVTAPSATTNGNGVAIDEIDIHDVSSGIADTWFFMGDSITAGAFTRRASQQPSYAAKINQMYPAYFPAMINGGIGGETSGSAVGHIDTWLQLNPDMKYWALAYGTNDAAGNNGSAATFKANMQTVIDRIKAAGRVPILAKIPYATDGGHNTVPLFNQAIDELNAANGLMSGPDLYAWFKAHPGELSSDGLHPNDAGSASINRLWAEAMSGLYR